MSESTSDRSIRERLVTYKTTDFMVSALVNFLAGLNGVWLWWYDDGIVATLGVVWFVFNLTPVVLSLLDGLASKERILYVKEEKDG